ncbi:MAG: transglutaminase family protein [Verrucomicrobiales bacterium]|nr:transglutaminase family protein [Verrucomicrobiales bacterium]
MAIHAGLYHRTSYRYDREVKIHPQIVRLRPAPHCRTPILSYSLSIEPKDHFLNWQQDAYGNYQARLVFPEKAEKMKIVVDLVADMTSINPFDFFLDEKVENFPFSYSPKTAADLEPYLRITDDSPALNDIAKELETNDAPRTIDYLVTVNQKVEQLVDYRVRLEPGIQSCSDTLELQSGSCRDSAFLLVQLFRRLGLAARFVSGYLIQLVADEKSLDGPSGPTEDFTDLHAWAEVYLPGAGWVGLDPTSGLFAGEGHIPLACTPEPSSAAPVQGAVDPCEVEFSFENRILRFHEDPRVTKPYSREEWKAVDLLGEKVDGLLKAGDVRLTMGGEPTFVSIDDMSGDEWNTTADSEHKRERAIDLTQRLRDAFAPGGLVWFGEGKWYPGEAVPRWAYGVFWRKDGYPAWRSGWETLADPAKPGNYSTEEPEMLIQAVARRLGIAEECVIPALEDVEYYRWRASTLPHYENAGEAEEDDSLERRTLAKLEKRGLDVPTGFVLPLFFEKEREQWTGAKWKLKREDLYLIPGSSAMGFRLPLDSIRKATEEDRIEEVSPMTGDFQPLAPDMHPDSDGFNALPASDWIPRTALTVENRDGRIHVFFPPASKTEAWLQLLAAVEQAALETKTKVVIEGYEPPPDPRIENLKVTPDPGVIEVNIHPSSGWSELVGRTRTIYDEARLSRLGTEKFMVDGRHSGTGGGNHIVIGGATPPDSPFLRRPDLLASLVAYWQNHPSLSYLFSGLFIGPTSQAPRVDESRDDRLFELDIALNAIRKGVDEPVMIDRIMRHLLTDMTGNTHRAEFCIDKMYAMDSARGQMGLLELRAFEMPPHAEMSLVQALLVRSLIALFWNRPYLAPLTRWGTALHDKFMMPHNNWQDIKNVCLDLKHGDIPFESEWLRPFFEFRFPRVGSVCYEGIELELRTALEPWHVLGEETTSQGTARYVDSSLERLQVRVRGLVPGRHILTCNDRRIPLVKTGTSDELVGAVRFKAWDPPSALHPMIAAQTPLIFSIIDVPNRKALGGCSYHVSHPGGLSYETFPVNAREAESRRVSRFWNEGHAQGVIETAPGVERVVSRFASVDPDSLPVTIPPATEFGDFPQTLDLRTG